MNPKSAILLSALTFAGAANANITISKAYGGGGNSGSYYGSDFVELVNTSTSAISLAGMTLYYLPAGSSGDKISTTTTAPAYAGALSNVTLDPGQYFLVQLASGTATNKASLPAADQTLANMNPSATGGRFLVYNGAAANGATVADLDPTKVQDYVAYGTTAGSGRYQGTGAAPTLTNTTAIVRKTLANGQYQNTRDNAADFGTATADATLKINNSASTYAPVPEPASMAALGLGVLGLLKRRRKA